MPRVWGPPRGGRIAVAEDASMEIDGYDMGEYSGISLVPRVSANFQFTEEWSAKLNISGVLAFEDEDGTVFMEMDGETDVSEFQIGGLAGYTLKVGDQLSVTPVLGLGWRSYELEGDMDDFSFGQEFDSSILTLDFGAEVAVKLNDKFGIAGGLLIGIPVSGSNDLETSAGDLDADLDGGFFFSIAADVEYKLTDMISLTGGLGYALTRVDWEWDVPGDTVDGEDELDRFTIRLGAVFSF
jgi:hypothetical protein